jgi:hypothetical protein
MEKHMSKTLLAMLLPFLNLKLSFGDGDVATVEVQQESIPETVEQEAKPAEEKVEKTFTQAELDEIVQKRLSKVERKLERRLIEAETRAKVVQEMQVKPEIPQGKPKIEDFNDYADYTDALTDWKVDQKLAQREEKLNEEKTQKVYESETSRLKDRVQETIEAGESKYDDFQDVVSNSKANISEVANRAILESDISHELYYHLAKNQDEAKRISELSPYAQAKEIGKLEDKLSKTKPTLTKKPDPLEPIDGGNAAIKTLETMTQAEYEAKRAKEGARWAR